MPETSWSFILARGLRPAPPGGRRLVRWRQEGGDPSRAGPALCAASTCQQQLSLPLQTHALTLLEGKQVDPNLLEKRGNVY